MYRAIVFVALLLVGATVHLATQPVQAQEKKKEDPIDGIAVVVWREYGENELAADTKYTGKLVRFGGGVQYVRKEGKGYILGMYSAVVNRPPVASIICKFAPGEEKSLADLKKDSSVYVIGVCRGKKTMAGADKGYVIIIEQCKRDNEKK